jgi:hypothetical protein
LLLLNDVSLKEKGAAPTSLPAPKLCFRFHDGQNVLSDPHS